MVTGGGIVEKRKRGTEEKWNDGILPLSRGGLRGCVIF